ncbi:response regulator [Desulfomonile tiedjei]|uniref:Response regulator with CheY-like receiver, AAA-type ATPase, and DNA-binding domains n=1 Tax=Desulfomonile tiedjei (strain ATCC 49306 / DSM 6799 / DCB-1) TaxID=706587 RepID=I4CAH6_DESTA|nr:response regulator [Desulfomonile tiedjei]AFM26567.1 response regulator with CheY-like receiver, AAA-type ATPase, and DNA-binding domains [Desulfomonile tiedjei DSM 6799]
MGYSKLLVVDDEQAFLSVMQKRLSRRGIDVSLAKSGEEAITEITETRDFDVVILDVRMPGLDGIQVLKEIKKISPQTQVIVLTAHPSFEAALEVTNLGAFAYLIKPCDFEELVTKVLQAAARRRRPPGCLSPVLEQQYFEETR